MFLYRPEYYAIVEDEEGNSTQGMAELIISKHRNGSLGTAKLKFIGKYTKFIDQFNFDTITQLGKASSATSAPRDND